MLTAQRNPPSCIFILWLTVSVTPSINTSKSSNDLIILIISLISSLEGNKGNPIPTLTAPFLLIFPQNLLHLKLNCLVIQVNFLLLKELQCLLVLSFLNYLTKNQKIHPICFISVGILLVKAFPILVVCYVVRSNSYGNSSSSKFFLFNLNIVPVLFLLQILICLIMCLLVKLLP